MKRYTSHVLVNAYERNRQAREACLRYHGRSCAVCGFNFEANYGQAAAGYIQVHHLIPIAQIGAKYRLRPIRDMRPVCPNCHAAIHRREPPFLIEEIKQMLRSHGAKCSPVGESGVITLVTAQVERLPVSSQESE